MIKAIVFDLDDTLLWDKKSVETAFLKTCEYAAKYMILIPLNLKKLLDWKLESFTKRTIHMILHRLLALTRLKACGAHLMMKAFIFKR